MTVGEEPVQLRILVRPSPDTNQRPTQGCGWLDHFRFGCNSAAEAVPVFRSVPISVREYLERRKCVIPQSSFDKTPHNVVRGRFTSATRTDIAVLCSVTDVSSVLVFRGGSTSDVSELATHPDEMFLQVVNPGVVGYSRALAVAGPAYIREHRAAYGGPQPPPLDHDGINDMFIEKGSVVWDWYRGEWLQLQGSD